MINKDDLVLYAQAVSHAYQKIKDMGVKDQDNILEKRTAIVNYIVDLMGMSEAKAYDAVDDAIETHYLKKSNPVVASGEFSLGKKFSYLAGKLS